MSIELTEEQIYCTMDLENWWHKKHSKQIFEISGPAGCGKAIPVDTIIPTPDGNKRIGDLKINDHVFNRFGKPVRVKGVYFRGKLDSYRVTFDDGRTAICNDDHLWTVIPCHVKGYTRNKEYTLPLKKILEIGLYNLDNQKQFKIYNNKAVEYKEKKFNIDPYDVGFNIKENYNNEIPEKYLYGSVKQRWDLVKGLFDHNGNIIRSNNRMILCFYTKDLNLLKQIKYLLNSLGIMSSYSCSTRVLEQFDSTCKLYYCLYVKTNDIMKHRFFRDKNKKELARSIDNHKRQKNYDFTYMVDIVKLPYKEEMCCIEVDDEDGLYLMNDFIVTHNTTIIKYFIERIGLSNDEVLFTSFSGKAVSQMARNGLPARTIHSSIYDYIETYARDESGGIILKDNGKPKKVFTFVLKSHLPKKIKLIVVDEGSMVGEKLALDLISFGIPIVCLGDLNQLPPVMDKTYFLKEPDFILTKIMRQKENDPIIWLSQQVLQGNDLQYGVYGNSAVIRKSDVTEFLLKNSDMILTGTNRLRNSINNKFREEIKGYANLDYPHIGERVICKKNDWTREIENGIYLTNGTVGFVENIDRGSYNKYSMTMDFRPDFAKKIFTKVKFDYNHMFNITPEKEFKALKTLSRFEFAYAITVHAVQGSEYESVLFMYENFFRNPKDRQRFLYTGITRATSQIIVVI